MTDRSNIAHRVPAALAHRADLVFATQVIGRHFRVRARSDSEWSKRQARLREQAVRVEAVGEEGWFSGEAAEARIVEPRRGIQLGQETWTWPIDPLPAAGVLGIDLRTVLAPLVVRVRREREAGPALLLVHGWLGANRALDHFAWPLSDFREFDFSVVHYHLPGHGLRHDPGRRHLLPTFPGQNPLVNALLLAQVARELGQVMAYLRRRGHDWVGLVGGSLGAYCIALAATVTSHIDGCILDQPLVKMTDPLRLDASPRQHELLDLAERTYAKVNPLQRAPRVASNRVRILSGRADAIVEPESVRRLAEHFGAELHWYWGGHLLPLGRRELWRHVLRNLCDARN